MTFVLNFFKWIGYLFSGMLIVLFIFLYFGKITIDPVQWNLKFYDTYFLVTLILLPFFRGRHFSWFGSNEKDEFVTQKQKALDLYHDDLRTHHKNTIWSSKHSAINPWEYTTISTMTYGNYGNWLYSFVKGFFMSFLFIVFAPFFYVVALVKEYRA